MSALYTVAGVAVGLRVAATQMGAPMSDLRVLVLTPPIDSAERATYALEAGEAFECAGLQVLRADQVAQPVHWVRACTAVLLCCDIGDPSGAEVHPSGPDLVRAALACGVPCFRVQVS